MFNDELFERVNINAQNMELMRIHEEEEQAHIIKERYENKWRLIGLLCATVLVIIGGFVEGLL